MDIAEETLLQLLSIAINGSVQKISSNVNWPKVLHLAQRQGVCGLVYETLEQLKNNNDASESFPNRTTLIRCFAQTEYVEKIYANHLKLVKEIVDLWKQQGIKTIVFKGIAHSRYYPKPAHREFGDFDCYLIDKQGKSAYNQGNDIAQRKGLEVDDSWYKHSHILYKQLTIENHHFFTSIRRGGSDMALNKYIVNAIGDGKKLNQLNGTNIYVLPIEAEGLFMLYHSLTHFLVEGLTLRHFADWACWIKSNIENIEWNDFYEKCKRFRLDGFVDVLNTIAVKYLGVDLHDRFIFADSLYALQTLESALHDDTTIYNRTKGRWYERSHIIYNALYHSWKYKYVARRSMLMYLWQSVYGFFSRPEKRIP